MQRIGRMATVNSFRTLTCVAALLVSATATMAQDKPAAPAAPSAGAPAAASAGDSNNPWNKLCGQDSRTKKQVCFTVRELRTDSGQFLASAGVREVDGESRKILLVQTPVSMLIQPGIRVQVDQNTQVPGKYTICMPNACFAEIPITDDFTASMKKGKDLIITTQNQQAKALNFPISLSGFTASYEGPAIDTAALQRQREQLASEVQRKAKEAQQKLLDAQNAASGAATKP
ncbi:invasion associated locus B family protein [Pleomorphomonas diazotrophica]|uniref:Invasion associated locus B family protein n=2 Tax=Pleomorphomonas diazotrophica TaxID=1166257 RepID=A0A2N3M041_9HYPH|nr:invasion associated locus B family protein [Pleomorphomonas diazotrophica]